MYEQRNFLSKKETIEYKIIAFTTHFHIKIKSFLSNMKIQFTHHIILQKGIKNL